MHDGLTRPAAAGIPIPEAWLILGVGTILSCALILSFPNDVGMKILAMTLFWLISLASVKFEITHPFFWFGGPFLVYSIAGPLLYTLEIHPNVMRGGFPIHELDFGFAMDLQYWGLLASSLVIGPRKMDLDAALRDPKTARFFNGVLPVLAVTILLSAFAVSEIISQGFTRKIDVILYGSWSTRFTFAFNMMSTCVGVFLVWRFVERKAPSAFIAIACLIALGLIVVLLTGQRNVLFRLLIVVIFAIHLAYHKISFRSFIVLFLVTSPLILILGGFKMAAVAGASAESALSTLQNTFVNGGAKLVHRGGAKLVHLM